MLSGISHDLRTPLTRLKLQLAMIKQKDLTEKMSKDIDEMEKMLNDYLQFAKNQVIENTNQIDLNSLFNEIKKLIDNKNLRIECESDINFNGRPGALKRSFQNVIQNGLTYGKSVNVNKSRSLNKSGVGLGLAIVEDVINSHGGNIQMGKSKMNGLSVKISLPY